MQSITGARLKSNDSYGNTFMDMIGAADIYRHKNTMTLV
jgi:hypothetical protein